jgi:hypothetical protein
MKKLRLYLNAHFDGPVRSSQKGLKGNVSNNFNFWNGQ